MKKTLYASPLFILRHECEKNLFRVLDRLQELGFDGVEMLGFFGQTPEAIARHLRGAGWRAMGNHVQCADFEADFERVMGDHLTIGANYISIQLDRPRLPGGELYLNTIDKLETWSHALAAQGITLLFHNHAGEFYITDDNQTALKQLLSDAPSLKLEPDLGWMGIAGEDPAEYLRLYAGCSPVLHFKDYYKAPGTPANEYAFRPTGYGVVQYPALMDLALACKPEWIVTDHDDAYGNDIYHELSLSLSYVRELTALHTGERNIKGGQV
jgi:sugar phosphate isomerase/epimerase